MDQSPDTVTGILQFLVANPVLLSSGVNIGYFIVGALLLRLVWSWINQSDATGKEFTLHGALDKIYNDTDSRVPLALLLVGIFVSLAVLGAAFVGG